MNKYRSTYICGHGEKQGFVPSDFACVYLPSLEGWNENGQNEVEARYRKENGQEYRMIA